MDKKKQRKFYLYAFGINFFIGMLIFGYFMLKNNGLFTLFADFNNQEIPFNILANQAIKSGETGWNWNIDLGTDFIGAFSFYNLGSPFFWVTLLADADSFPYLIGWIYVLKYAVAGLTSYTYMQLFVKNKKYAVAGSMLYAFSGFQSANLLFYHFHDVTALFPLLLYGLEKLIEENKKMLFAFVVFLNALLNYFFFFGEVLFVVLYFLVRFEKRDFIKNTFKCIKEGILGICMAGILFLPSVVFVLENPRTEQHISGKNMFLFSFERYLQITRALLLPGENMSAQSSVFSGEWSSCAAYLPMVGLVLIVAYVLKEKHSWLSRMLKICAVIAFVPVLSSAFYMFNEMVYQRWFYMAVLLMALASALVLEHNERYPVKKAAMIISVLTGLVTIVVAVFRYEDGSGLIFRPVLYWLIFGIAMVGYILTWFICGLRIKKKLYVRLLFTMTGLFCIVTTSLNCVLYRKNSCVNADTYYKEIMSTHELPQPEEGFRYICRDNLINMVAPVSGMGSWCSTVGKGIFEFYDALGLARGVDSPEGPDGTAELLSGKYYLVSENIEEGKIYYYVDENVSENLNLEIEKKLDVEGGITEKTVYEIKDALPIGFTYNTYMTKSEFEKILPENRALAMLKTLVINDEDEKLVSEVLTKYNVEEHGEISSSNKKEDIAEHAKEASKDFKKDKNGFSCSITSDSDKYAFFSVPNDSGWTAFVNGQQTKILNINGLMAVEIEEGQNEIVFRYATPMGKEGIALSVISFAVWLMLCWKQRKEQSNACM